MTNAIQVTYGILSWSYKTYRARYNYRCANCEGIIPSGTKYLRHVERLGANKGVDPLRNVHVHLDCTAPWYQPEAPHRLKHLGNLPGRLPPVAVHDPAQYYHKPSVAIATDAIGILLWQPPAELAAKLAFCPRQHLSHGAMADIEATLTIVMTALVQASGHRRKAMKLNHLIEEITRLLDPVTVPEKSDL